jgi:hypothetical protein
LADVDLRHRNANPGTDSEQTQKAGGDKAVPRKILALLHVNSDQK